MAKSTALTVQFDHENFSRAMREVPDDLFRELMAGIKTHHRRFLLHFKRTRLRKKKSGDGVQSRSGALRRSFDNAWGGNDLDSMFVQTHSAGVPYASIQEEGGEIKPRRGNWLTIPLDAAKTAAGVTRKPARQWNDTWFWRLPSGALLLMQDRGDDFVPLFLLVKKVVLKGTLGFMDTWDAELPKLVKIVNKATKSALEAVKI